jgi:hypothetical protein
MLHRSNRLPRLHRTVPPTPRVRNANHMKDQKQRHQKRWNQAKRKHRQSASFHATSEAVIPINMSPYPADHAKTPGSIPRASSSKKVNPIILHVCTAVKPEAMQSMFERMTKRA